MTSTRLKGGSSLRPLRILVCRYSRESLLYSGKKHFYGNGEGLQCIHQYLKSKIASQKITKHMMQLPDVYNVNTSAIQ